MFLSQWCWFQETLVLLYIQSYNTKKKTQKEHINDGTAQIPQVQVVFANFS